MSGAVLLCRYPLAGGPSDYPGICYAYLAVLLGLEVRLGSHLLGKCGLHGCGACFQPFGQNLFDLLQFEADLQSTRLKRNAVACAFVSRKGQSTRRVRSKLQQIEKI